MLELKKIIPGFAVILCIASIGSAEEVGRVAATRGKVFFQRKSGSVQVKVNAKIQRTDIIETKAGSKVKLLFNDDSLITLSENSKISIKNYMESKPGKKGLSILRLFEGEVRSLTGKNKFEIHTPTAVAAARGTFYTVWVEMDGGLPVTNIAVFDGEVDASNIATDVKGLVSVSKGKVTRVPKGKPPAPPENIPADLQDRLLDCEE